MDIFTKVFASLLIILVTTTSTQASDAPAVILAVTGTVTIQRNGSAVPAIRKSTLLERDEIHTGNDGRAQIRFMDGTVTTLGANTIFLINTYHWSAKSDKEAEVNLQLIQGAFRTITGHVLDVAGSQFEVFTPVGVIGIRGTDFWGGYLDPGNIDVLLISGEHAVTVSNKAGSVKLRTPGEGTTLMQDQREPQVKTWPKPKVDRAVATITWPADAKEQPE